MSWDDGYIAGYSKGFADAEQVYKEMGRAAAEFKSNVSFSPCARWDFKGSYCIEGIDCSCVHQNRWAEG